METIIRNIHRYSKMCVTSGFPPYEWVKHGKMPGRLENFRNTDVNFNQVQGGVLPVPSRFITHLTRVMALYQF